MPVGIFTERDHSCLGPSGGKEKGGGVCQPTTEFVKGLYYGFPEFWHWPDEYGVWEDLCGVLVPVGGKDKRVVSYCLDSLDMSWVRINHRGEVGDLEVTPDRLPHRLLLPKPGEGQGYSLLLDAEGDYFYINKALKCLPGQWGFEKVWLATLQLSCPIITDKIVLNGCGRRLRGESLALLPVYPRAGRGEGGLLVVDSTVMGDDTVAAAINSICTFAYPYGQLPGSI